MCSTGNVRRLGFTQEVAAILGKRDALAVVAMFRDRIITILAALAVTASLALPFASPAEAQGLRDRRPPDEHRIEPGGYSLDDAVELAQNRYRAKVVKAETVAEEGRRVHYIRLLNTQGRVWTVRVDAETGRIF